MVLSHGDRDHIGGVPEILGAYQVHKIIRPGKKATALQENMALWEEADRAIRSEGAEVVDLSDEDVPFGTRYQFGETTLTLVSGFALPPDEWGELQPAHARNAGSIVIRLEFAGRSVLFTGDAIGCEHYEIDECDQTIATEKYMLENSGSVSIKSDVIVAPHHGSISSSSPEFIARVAPKWVIVPSGHRYELPRTATVERYIKAGVLPWRILRTDRGDHEGPKEWPQGKIEGVCGCALRRPHRRRDYCRRRSGGRLQPAQSSTGTELHADAISRVVTRPRPAVVHDQRAIDTCCENVAVPLRFGRIPFPSEFHTRR